MGEPPLPLYFILLFFVSLSLCITSSCSTTQCLVDKDSFLYFPGVGVGSVEDIHFVSVIDPSDQLLGKEGERILIIQMQGGGATFDQFEGQSFGTVLNYGNMGKFEFNYIKGLQYPCDESTTKRIILEDSLVNTFIQDPFSSFQVVIGVHCINAQLIDDINCQAWDGEKGGVIWIEASTFDFNNHIIDCSKAGFHGGYLNVPINCDSRSQPTGPDLYACGDFGGPKGEANIKNEALGFSRCRGAYGSGGGGSPCTQLATTSNHRGAGGGGMIGN